MSAYIGTSGWAYKEWKPDFYPEGLPQKRFLEHYCSLLGACEINATFYRLQSNDTFAKWAEASPPSFRFSTKAHRRVTHMKRMAPDEATRVFLETYLKSVTSLGERLGVVLLQFPPYKERDDEGLDAFLDAMTTGGVPFACEFRNESWDSPEVRAHVGARGGTVCLSNTDGAVPASLPPGPLAYVRLRAERYSDEARAGWLELLRKESELRPVYAFTKHEGIPTVDTYGGIGLARWLAERTAPEAPA